MPDRVLRATHRAAPNIYEGDLITLTETIFRDLNVIARNSGDAIIYIGNGHAAWEASLVNLFSKGDSLLALVTGRFGQGWADTASALGIDVQVLDFGMQSAVEAERIAHALQADTDHKIKAVMTVQTDTATSVTNDIALIRNVLNETGHPALLMADCIASFACEPFDMDKLGVDVMVTASQKGLMTPPGLAIVFISENVWPLHEKAELKTPYWNWKPRARPAFYAAQFCGTAPTHHLYGIREALDMLLEEGMENIWHRHRVQAEAVWAAVQAWGSAGALQLNVPVEAHRSLAVTCVMTQGNLAARLRRWCDQEAGLTLGIGLNLVPSGPANENIFRIGHMGHLNPHSLLGTLACIETGLNVLQPGSVGKGVEAASAVIASYTG